MGDYGLAPCQFLDEYVPVNGEPQPVRWMPPEVLEVLDSSSSSHLDSSSCNSSIDGSSDNDHFLQSAEIPWTRTNGVWSLAVTLWEVSNCGTQMPFQSS